MDKLLTAIWDGISIISSHGYRAFRINTRYVVLYLNPDASTHFANISVRPDIKYIDTVPTLTAAAALIQRKLEG